MASKKSFFHRILPSLDDAINACFSGILCIALSWWLAKIISTVFFEQVASLEKSPDDPFLALWFILAAPPLFTCGWVSRRRSLAPFLILGVCQTIPAAAVMVIFGLSFHWFGLDGARDICVVAAVGTAAASLGALCSGFLRRDKTGKPPAFNYYLVEHSFIARCEKDWARGEMLLISGEWWPYNDIWDISTNGRFLAGGEAEAMELFKKMKEAGSYANSPEH